MPPAQAPQPTQNFGQTEPPKSGPKDIDENKGMAMIAYLGVLCFLPLFLKKDSEFAQYHGKQGLVLLIAWVAVNVLYFIPLIGWVLIPVGQVVGLILVIVGMLNAWHGEMKELPWIGKFGKNINL